MPTSLCSGGVWNSSVATVSPERVISPEVIFCRPANDLKSVVFPQPLGPKTAKHEPFGAVIFTFSKMRAGPILTDRSRTFIPCSKGFSAFCLLSHIQSSLSLKKCIGNQTFIVQTPKQLEKFYLFSH